MKAKVQFLEQLKKNGFACMIHEQLFNTANGAGGGKQSFYFQLKELERELNITIRTSTTESRWQAFANKIKSPDEMMGLIDSIKTVYMRWGCWSWARSQLGLLLRVDFGERRNTTASESGCDELAELLDYLERLDYESS